MKQFDGKVAVITGGARGIGFGIAAALGAEGCRLVIADIGEEQMAAAVERLSERECLGRGVCVDVTEESSVQSLLEDVVRNEGGIDIWVNSAGVAPHIIPAISLSISEWRRIIDVNLFGVFLCCREVGGLMAKHGRGTIINIASLNAVSPAALCVAYNVAKAGVISLTQTLAIELASLGVRVNAISPGPVETEFHDIIMPERASTLGITRDEMIEKVRQAIPLGRWGRPDDIAQAVLFLASERSDWMTGQNLIISGGMNGVAALPPKEVILGSLEASVGKSE